MSDARNGLEKQPVTSARNPHRPREAANLPQLAQHVAKSGAFERTQRHRELLLFLASRPGGVDWKETWIGHHFFGRPADYDPKVDPVVRVEVRRLRERLEHYYANEGRQEDWRLEIPRGAYALVATPNSAPNAAGEQPQEQSADAAAPVEAGAASKSRTWPKWTWVLGGSAAIGLIVFGWWFGSRNAPIRTIEVRRMKVDQAAKIPGISAEIAARLNDTRAVQVIRGERADAALSGEAAFWNGRLRLQVQLERNRDRSLLWARTYDRDIVDPFSLQEELAVTVAMGVRDAIGAAVKSKRQPIPESDREAKRGWKLLERTSAPGLKEALEAFKHAARIDPDNADAWAGICDSIGIAPDYMATPPEWTAEGRAAGQKALSLDPENIEALTALGWLEYSRELRAVRAERMLKQAVALRPDSLRTRRRLALVWLGMGRFAQAEQQIRTVIEMDPLSLISKINLAEIYSYQGDYTREISVLKDVLKAQPNYVLGRVMMAAALSSSGRCAEALAIVRLLRAEPDAAGWEMPNLSIEARCGQPARARAYLDRAKSDPTAWTIAFELRNWPLTYASLETFTRQLPSSARVSMLGPHRKILLTYPPIAKLIAEVDEMVARPD